MMLTSLLLETTFLPESANPRACMVIVNVASADVVDVKPVKALFFPLMLTKAFPFSEVVIVGPVREFPELRLITADENSEEVTVAPVILF